MQPATSSSPWPKRILIVGIALALLGSISLVFSQDHLEGFYDPRETSEYTAEYGEVNTITLEPGCWVVNVEGSDSDYDVSFKYIVDDTAGDAVSEDCKTDFQAAADVDFDTVAKLDIEETSEILVTISCKSDGDCEKPLLFTDGGAVVNKMLTDSKVLVTGGLCCVGFILVPLGWLLISINRGRENKVHLSQNQIVTAMTPLEENLPKNKEILTTDELYQLVRGEVPGSGEKEVVVPSPFTGVDTRTRTATTTKVGGSINRASIHTPENPPKDESWKNWDES